MLARLVVRSRKPTATRATIDERNAASRTDTRDATASGMSSESWNVNSPPITTKTPCAKFTMPVVR